MVQHAHKWLWLSVPRQEELPSWWNDHLCLGAAHTPLQAVCLAFWCGMVQKSGCGQHHGRYQTCQQVPNPWSEVRRQWYLEFKSKTLVSNEKLFVLKYCGIMVLSSLLFKIINVYGWSYQCFLAFLQRGWLWRCQYQICQHRTHQPET